MAIVKRYGSGIVDPATLRRVGAINAENKPSHGFSVVGIEAGDNAGSTFPLITLPSSARLLSLSSLAHTAITGLTSLHIGLTDGTTTVAAALASALNVAGAGTKAVNAAVATANLDRRLWQLLGLSADPGRQLEIFVTMNTDATAAGTLVAQFYWSTEG